MSYWYLKNNNDCIISDDDFDWHDLSTIKPAILTFNYKDIRKAKAFADKLGGKLVRLDIEED